MLFIDVRHRGGWWDLGRAWCGALVHPVVKVGWGEALRTPNRFYPHKVHESELPKATLILKSRGFLGTRSSGAHSPW